MTRGPREAEGTVCELGFGDKEMTLLAGVPLSLGWTQWVS